MIKKIISLYQKKISVFGKLYLFFAYICTGIKIDSYEESGSIMQG